MKFKLIVSGTAVVMLLAVAWPAAGQDPPAGRATVQPTAESQAEQKEPEGETQATQEPKAKSKSKKESKKQSAEEWGFRWADHPSLQLGPGTRVDFRLMFGYRLIFAALWFTMGVLAFTFLPC